MFLVLVSLLLTPMSYAASSSTIRSTPSLLRSHRSRLSTTPFGRIHISRPPTIHASTLAKIRRMREKAFTPHADTNAPHKAIGVLYDVVDTMDSRPVADEASESNAGIDGFVSTAINGTTQTVLSSTTTTQSFKPFDSTTSDALPYRTAVPMLPNVSPPRTRLHSFVISIFVGSAVGVASLVVLALLSVCFCRRTRARMFLQKEPRISRWFRPDKKDDFVVSIHVPPPTVPLKSILLPSPSSTIQNHGGPHPDRVSLTSSQLSVIINNLPKAHTSGLEHGVLPQVHPDIRDVPMRATRIGPSPSDFFANLFGQASSFTSSNSASSHELSHQSAPLHDSEPQMQHRSDKFSRPLTAPKSTFPQPSISPYLGVTSGPRGHGLVLTGDQNAPAPSFAQWHYQRSLARRGSQDLPHNSLTHLARYSA